MILSVASCNRIKRKGHQIVDKTRDELITKKNEVVEKLIPPFDSYTADTKYNKKRFAEFFGFAPTPDVIDLYCYNDQIGIDSKFQFSFKCNSTTKHKIVNYLSLTQSREPDNFSKGLWRSFKWWDSAKIVTLHPYWRKDEHESYKYLWFDTDSQTAYYFHFDM